MTANRAHITAMHPSLIDSLVPALQLLHHCFYYARDPEQSSPNGIPLENPWFTDLPQVLQNVSAYPAFSALDHTFIVTMARIGYADVPEWFGRAKVRVIDDVAGESELLLVEFDNFIF